MCEIFPVKRVLSENRAFYFWLSCSACVDTDINNTSVTITNDRSPLTAATEDSMARNHTSETFAKARYLIGNLMTHRRVHTGDKQ